ncbi:hypothetical protein LKL81_26075 [Bacillus paranthracis]|uniref:hypothetical protein n=1 Tax=Bacillus paranthracis TaxID=2026186 RepID=UPI001E604BB0|nr:hypothetical protein [Bacillus paranthracis]MCC2430682.1 hypothetical protein [Bacillus paranthracis]
MKISEVRKRIKEYQEYLQLHNEYKPNDMKEHAIKLYAELQNVGKVATHLNEMGFRLEGKKEGNQVKLTSNDVTALIDTKPDPNDKLHFIVRKALNKNRSKQRR